MATDKNLSNLVLNKVENKQVFNYMQEHNLVNEDELYLVIENDEVYAKKNHASATTDYGVGDKINHGHVKLSDSTNSASGISGGIAATPAAVKAVKELADSKAPAYTYGTEDLTPGVSPLVTGTLYFVYE